MKTYQELAASSEGRPFIVAHRGAWGPAPENSTEAVDAAVAAGYDVAEIDVRLSADGVPVTFHDDTLDRMTGLARRPGEIMAARLTALKLRAGSGGPDSPVTDVPVQTLAQVLEAARGRICVDIDVKDRDARDAVRSVVADMKVGHQVDIKLPYQLGVDVEQALARDEAADIGRMLIVRFDADNWRATLRSVLELRPFLVETEFDTYDRLVTVARVLRDNGVALWVNTLDAVHSAGLSDSKAIADPGAVWGALIDAGVSFIQTDRPDAVAQFRAHSREAMSLP